MLIKINFENTQRGINCRACRIIFKYYISKLGVERDWRRPRSIKHCFLLWNVQISSMRSGDKRIEWLMISKIYKNYIYWDSWRSVGITEWYEIKYINECYNGTVLKPRTLYKGNFIKYKGKSWKAVFWLFKWLNIFISCLMALVCIPEILMDFLTPILSYIAITNVVCQMRHLCQKCLKCHNWRIWHATFLMDIYGNMGVKRSVRASGIQTNDIKQLLNMFNHFKFPNIEF